VGMAISVESLESLPTHMHELELFPHIWDVAITKNKIIKQKSKK
jgi:hypothetical protein